MEIFYSTNVLEIVAHYCKSDAETGLPHTTELFNATEILTALTPDEVRMCITSNELSGLLSDQVRDRQLASHIPGPETPPGDYGDEDYITMHEMRAALLRASIYEHMLGLVQGRLWECLLRRSPKELRHSVRIALSGTGVPVLCTRYVPS